MTHDDLEDLTDCTIELSKFLSTIADKYECDTMRSALEFLSINDNLEYHINI